MISVRRAVPEDLAFVSQVLPRLTDAGFSPAYFATSELIRGTLRHLRSALERASEDELFAIACEDGRQVGFLWADTKRDYFTGELHGYIEEVAVASDGRGVGSRLMDFAESWARERGYRYVSLSVRPANERAKAMYARRGYGIDVEVRLKIL